MPTPFFTQAKRILLQIKIGNNLFIKFKEIVEKNTININDIDESNGHSLLIVAINLITSASYQQGILLLNCVQLLLKIPGLDILRKDAADMMATQHFARLKTAVKQKIDAEPARHLIRYQDEFVKIFDETQEHFAQAIFRHTRELPKKEGHIGSLTYDSVTGNIIMSWEASSSEEAKALEAITVETPALPRAITFTPPTHPPRHLRSYQTAIIWTAIPDELTEIIVNIECIVSAYEMDELKTWKHYDAAQIIAEREREGIQFRLCFTNIPWALLDAPDTTPKTCPCMKYLDRIKQIRQEVARSREPVSFSPSTFFAAMTAEETGDEDPIPAAGAPGFKIRK